jgi:hypothetical protein
MEGKKMKESFAWAAPTQMRGIHQSTDGDLVALHPGIDEPRRQPVQPNQ